MTFVEVLEKPPPSMGEGRAGARGGEGHTGARGGERSGELRGELLPAEVLRRVLAARAGAGRPGERTRARGWREIR